MKLKKTYSFFVLASAIAMSACSDNKFEISQPPVFDPVPAPEEVVVSAKPKAMWIDVHANFNRLSTKAGIDAELQKIHDNGFNMIYLDVKSGNGYALYKSDFLPYCNQYADLSVTRDYDDYLGYFIEKCDDLGIDIVASICATGWGYQQYGQKQGFVFDNWTEWGDKVQMRSDEDNHEITVPITNDPAQAITMLDPMYPEVQDLILNTIKEVVTKYPKLKGISLDYLRYANNDKGWFGMGDNNMKGFAEYWNESVPDHLEIVTASGGVGPKFAKWIEYRASVVTGVLQRIHDTVKSINPDCEIHLWAGADWSNRYTVGQNWASKRYVPKGSQYTDTYNKTGFADLLDVFVIGAYTQSVWKKENPQSIWSVENFVKSWNFYIMDDCRGYGSIATYAHDKEALSDATYLCLAYTDGYMNFELSHINNGDKWGAALDGMKRYEEGASNN